MTQEIRIPDIGDAESVEVVEILAAPGDTVGPDDPVIVIESDKASMEVPAGLAGVIERITVALGDQVTEGQVIATLVAAEGKTAEPAAAPDAAAPPAPAAPKEAAAPKEPAARTESAAPKEAAPKGPAAAKESVAAEEEAAEPRAAAAPREPAAPQEPAAPPESGASKPAGARHEVRVPDIGEAEAVVVIEIAVAVGDEVAADDLLVVIESDKASMELPVGVAGRIVDLHVKAGDEISEGALLATVEVAGAAAADAPEQPARAQAPAQDDATGNRRSAAASTSGAGAEPAAAAAQPAAAAAESVAAAAEPAAKATGGSEPGGESQVYAGPAVRRLARELGVSLQQVAGSGLRGRIVKDDVKSFVKGRLRAPAAAPAGGGLPAMPEIDFSRFGPIETVPLSRIRARGADNLHRSWVNIPHVTHHDDVDVTDLEAFRRSLKAESEARGVKLTPVAFLIKACCQALAEFPAMNSSLDPGARNYILKRYYHIGIAVDTDEGLVVPVIRDANRKGLWELAREVAELSEKARARKLTVADHQGGTFSITSLGTLGGTAFTPIINAPEVAILGVARLATRPQWNGSAFVPREMLPLSLSYDHRAINGAEAARFMARLAQLLGDIRRLAL